MSVRRKSKIVDGVINWQCSCCEKFKPAKMFHRNRSAFNGLATLCKVCRCAAQAKNREDNPEKVCRQRNESHHRHKERNNTRSRAYARAHGRESRIRNKVKIDAWERNYRQQNREKLRAKYAVNRALKSGALVRPTACEMCPALCRPLAHHDSYDIDRRLVVTWLCDRCHVWVHHRRREQRNAA